MITTTPTRKTIGNPLTWGARAFAGAGTTMGEAATGIVSHEAAPPRVHRITVADLREALRRGAANFAASRSDVLFLVALYPLFGLLLSVFAFNAGLLPLVFPMAAGFALIGPVAGLALYEMSRRIELGESLNWGDALSALRTRVLGPVLVLGVLLMGIFVAWMFAAHLIYVLTLGPEPPAAPLAFLREVLTTGAGWTMIVLGMAVGFVFAVAVLVISLVSFPMMIDRRAGVAQALVTSVEVARLNPVPVAVWGLIVAVSLAVGSIPAFLGLIVVLPVLGHATWHVYRAAVSHAEDPA